MPISLPEWPTTRLESFKYTNLKPLAALELPVGRSTLRHAPQLEGITVAPLGSALVMPGTPVVIRALAAADDGWQIDVSGQVAAPLELCLLGEGATAPRLLLRLAKGASLTLFEEASTAGLANQLWQIELAEGAQLTHVRLQNAPATAMHLATSAVTLQQGAGYKLTTLNTGAALARYEPHITLAAAGAEVSLTAINLLTGQQHGDVTTVLHHTAPGCSSQQVVRSVMAGQARGVYQGQIIVAPDAQKASAKQSSKALLLSAQAEMNVKPELEIYADDVQCGHGATIGSIDPGALFYLRARGVPEAAARQLLVAGFVSEALEGIGNDSLRLRLDQAVAQWLEQVS